MLDGDDSLTLPFMSVGAEGVISVASHLFLQASLTDGQLRPGQRLRRTKGKIHRQLYPIFKALFVEPNPVPVKTALARAGIIGTAEVRPPLCEMTDANRAVLEQALVNLGK